jgi:hypothetical protein
MYLRAACEIALSPLHCYTANKREANAANARGYFIGDLAVEDINGTVTTPRTFVTQRRMRAFTACTATVPTGNSANASYTKYGKIDDEEILEGTWQDYAPTMQK